MGGTLPGPYSECNRSAQRRGISMYQQPQGYGQPYGDAPPPRRRRGLKRTIFGVLGILANGVGLVVMPFLVGMIGAVLTVGASQNLTALDPQHATIEGDSMRVYSLAVPAEHTGTVECAVTGGDAVLTSESSDYSVGTIDGTDYYDVYDLQISGSDEVTVECTGTEALGLWDAGMGGTLISFGIGFLVPVVLGLLSVALTIWGIVALVRST